MRFTGLEYGALFSYCGHNYMRIEVVTTSGGLKNAIEVGYGKGRPVFFPADTEVDSANVALVNVGQE